MNLTGSFASVDLQGVFLFVAMQREERLKGSVNQEGSREVSHRNLQNVYAGNKHYFHHWCMLSVKLFFQDTDQPCAELQFRPTLKPGDALTHELSVHRAQDPKVSRWSKDTSTASVPYSKAQIDAN